MVSSISSALSSAIDYARMQKEMFAKADSDGDGELSLTEFEAAKPADAPVNGPSSSELFTNLNSDQDGSLTEEEMQAGAKKMGPPPGGMPPAQGLSEDSVKTLLELLAEELEESLTQIASDEDEASEEAVSAAQAEDESETAAEVSDEEEEKALALIQQLIDDYRNAQASYMSAQNLAAGTTGKVSTVG